MRLGGYTWFWLAIALQTVYAQSSPSNSSPTDSVEESSEAPNSNPTNPIRPDGTIQPDAYYLRDKFGQPIYIPRVAYEEFAEHLRQKKNNSEGSAIAAVIQDTQGEIRVAEGLAQMELRLTAQLLDSSVLPIRIPIGLRTCDVRLAANSDAANGFVKIATPESRRSGTSANTSVNSSAGLKDGYEWWITDVERDRVTLEILATVKVEGTSEKQWIDFELPAARTNLMLIVGEPDLDVQLIEGVPASTVRIESTESSTRADFVTVGGRLMIAWQNRQSRARLSTVEAAANTKFTMSSSERMRGRTEFVFDSTVAPGSTFYIDLPENSTWEPQRSLLAPYEIRELDVDVGESPTSNKAKRLQLTIGSEGIGQAPVEIRYELPIVPDEYQATLQAPQLSTSGNDVPIEVRSNSVTVSINEDYRFGWTNIESATFLEQSRDSENRANLSYRFEPESQNFRIDATMLRLDNSQNIQSAYLLEIVSESDAVLTGIVEFEEAFTGTFGLQIDTRGWEITSLQAYPEAARTIRFDVTQDGTVVPFASDLIPDLAAEATNIRALELRATKSNQSTLGSIELPVFEFQINGEEKASHGDGSITISHPSSISCEIESDTSSGLMTSRKNSAIADTLISRIGSRERKSFEFSSRQLNPVVNLRLQQRESFVFGRAECLLSVAEEGSKVEATWEIETQHGVPNQMSIQIPNKFVQPIAKGEFTTISVEIDGQAVPWFLAEDPSPIESMGNNNSQEFTTIQVELNQRKTSFTVRVNLAQSNSLLDSSESSFVLDVAIPQLKFDHEFNFEFAPIRLVSDPSTTVRVRDRNTQRHSPQELWIKNGDGITNIELEVTKESASPLEMPRMQRAWLETVLSDSTRRDRLATVVSSNDDSISCTIPDFDSFNLLQVFVDGEEVIPFSSLPRSEFTIPLIRQNSEVPTSNTYSVEIWMWRSLTRSPFQQVRANFPTVNLDTSTTQFYWEVISLSREHLVSYHESLHGEFQWKWNQFGFERSPNLPRVDLTRWSGTNLKDDTPFDENANRYVFSARIMPDTPGVRLAPIWILWLPISASVLAAAAVFSVFPKTRHPLVLVAAGLSLIGLWLYSPSFAVVIMQALFGGMLCLIILFGLNSVIMSRVRNRSVFSARMSRFKSVEDRSLVPSGSHPREVQSTITEAKT